MKPAPEKTAVTGKPAPEKTAVTGKEMAGNLETPPGQELADLKDLTPPHYPAGVDGAGD